MRVLIAAQLLILLLILCLASSCGVVAQPTVVSATATTAPPTIGPTDTPTLPTLTPAPTRASLQSLTEWDLVVIGDSSAWGFADSLAVHIENDLGVTVRVHEKAIGNLSAWNVRKWVREREDWRELLRQAEMVTLYGNPRLLNTAEMNCEDPLNTRMPGDCSPEHFEPYVAGLKEIIGEILALRGDAPVIIRVMDCYVPILSVWKERGVQAECTRCWENYAASIHKAAAAYSVPVARVYDAFNGPGHDEDPREKGYIGPDGIHTTELGRQVIADLFRELGYEPTVS